jgi:hypothetical protein
MEPVEKRDERSDWTFQLSSACQRLAGATIDADSTRFRAAIREFGAALPECATPYDRMVVTDRAHRCATRAGLSFHVIFHERFAPEQCVAAPIEAAAPVWNDSEAHPRDLLGTWVERYLEAFDQGHESPAALRVAARLERQYCEQLPISVLAKESSCSRTVLQRGSGRRLVSRSMRSRHASGCGMPSAPCVSRSPTLMPSHGTSAIEVPRTCMRG